MNYVIAGPPGSGKTTYAMQRMVQDDVLLDVDLLYVALSGRAMYDKPVSLLGLVLGVREFAVNWLAERGHYGDAYVITASGSRAEHERLRYLLDGELIVLEVNAAICKQRIANDPRRQGQDIWPALVDEWWSEYTHG